MKKLVVSSYLMLVILIAAISYLMLGVMDAAPEITANPQLDVMFWVRMFLLMLMGIFGIYLAAWCLKR